jgi:ATP-binding cassette, subfamily B, bacterial PglK
MNSIILQAFSLFSSKEKFHLALLFLLMFITGLIEAFGIGMIFPFISVVSDNSILDNNRILKFFFEISAFESKDNFVILLGSFLFVFFIFKNSFFFYAQFIQQNYLIKKRVEMTGAMFLGYMQSKYELHLNSNPAHLLRNINSVDGIFSGLLQPFFEILSELFILVGIATVLMYSNWLVMVGAFCIILIPTFIINRITSRILKKTGHKNFHLIAVTSKTILEGLNGIKEILVMNRQGYFANSYIKESRKLGYIRRDLQLMSFIPRLSLETLLVGTVILFIIVLMTFGKALVSFLPTLTLFSVAAVRLLTSINKIVLGFQKLSFSSVLSDNVIKDLKSFETRDQCSKLKKKFDYQELQLHNEICLKNLSFSYTDSDKPALKNIDIKIKKGSSVGFVGPSGAGKSTLIDIILGLIDPDKGSIHIDDYPLSKIRKQWSSMIGYIPQSIYLRDDTLKNNIAFGMDESEINEDLLQKAIDIAQLNEVINNLPLGLETIIGERGVRISGGQRQRVAISRALYHDPEIIIMDEATSALDNQTEAEFIKAVEELKKHKTLIIVAHRLSTVKNCDIIYLMKDGQIHGQGNLETLMASNVDFLKLAQLDPGITCKDSRAN